MYNQTRRPSPFDGNARTDIHHNMDRDMDHDIVPHITLRGPLRLLVGAPLGAVANLFDPNPDPAQARSCDDRGQHELDVAVTKINDHLRQAHGTGHLAIAFGVPILQRKAAEKVAAARTRPASHATSPSGHPGTTTAAPPERSTSHEASVATTAEVAAADLAIPGYDTLSASQVVECLAGLDDEARNMVRAYEAANRGRRTVLGKLDQLQATG